MTDPFLDEHAGKPPHHPDRFRVTHHRARHYIDPLPACELWAATDERWPSVTTIKNRAWPGTFRKSVDVGGERVTVPLDVVRTLDHLRAVGGTIDVDDPAAVSALLCAASDALDAAAARGNEVHDIMEGILNGDGYATPSDAAAPYVDTLVDALRAMFGDANVVLTERVAFHRGYGYAGTFDVLACLNGCWQVWDLKTRGDDAKHLDPYEPEAAQVGAYASCTYYVDTVDGVARRIPMPEISGGGILAVAPGRWQATPLDIEPARKAWFAMHTTATTRKDGEALARSSVAKAAATVGTIVPPLAVDPRPRMATLTDTQRAHLKNRWPFTVPASQLTADQWPQLAQLLDDVTDAPFDPPPTTPPTPATVRTSPPPTTPPDDGGEVDPSTVELIQTKARALPSERRAWMAATAADARAAGRATTPGTVRWFEVARAMMAASAVASDDDEYVRHWLAAAIDSDGPLMPTVSVGAVFGSLTIDEARKVADWCERAAAGAAVLEFGDAGRPRAVAA